MKMTGEEVIAAPRQLVWDALNDPEILKQCIPGCDEIKKKSDTEFEAKVTARVGPVKASFTGNVKLSKLNAPRSYVISGEGKGGVAGFAKGGATIRLSETGDHSTKLAYDVDAQVGGKLAQIGSRLIDSTARKMAAEFFSKFNKLVSQMAESTEMATKKPAKKAAKAATKTKAAASKAAGKVASKTTAASKTAAKKATRVASKAGAKATTASKTAAKKATKAASKTAVKKAAKAASKTAAKKTVRASAPVASSARQAASGPAAKAADQVQPVAGSASASTSQPMQAAKKVESNAMPPQAKAMSGMWVWIVLAAAAGLIVIWATGS